MTAKEKAVDLMDEFYDCLENVLELYPSEINKASKDLSIVHVKHLLCVISGLDDSVWGLNMKSFYEEVKTELEKI